MKSIELSGFSRWCKWDSKIFRDASNLPGVYAFRLTANSFGRLKGKSDLVYIGCTESSQGTVSSRLRDHLSTRAEGSNVAQRLCDTREVGELEVAWKILASSKEAIDEEARLLRAYYRDHIEPPPVNRAEPSRPIRRAIQAVAEFILQDKHFRHLTAQEAHQLAEKLVERLANEELHEKDFSAGPPAGV